MITQHIVTHTSPDWDAITAVWLLRRYGGLQESPVLFVNTDNPDRDVLDSAIAVVDTGRELDPARLRFDHHQLPGQGASATCAADLVRDHLFSDTQHWIDDIVMLVWAGDTGRKTHGADVSRTVGIHALLSHQKTLRKPDDALLAFGLEILDALAAHLEARQTARLSLAQHTVYLSADGLVRGLAGAPQGATFAAFEEGARVVVFTSEAPGTVSVGAMRGGEGHDPHIGNLVMWICNDYECGLPNVADAVYEELARWYRHEAGFFAGRGTAKAPDPRPLIAEFAAICAALDEAWKTR